MTKEKKKLLIVDDEEVVLNSLVRSFKGAQHFEFETTAVLDLMEMVRQELEEVEFDVWIVDLGFGPSDRELDYLGFMALDRSELPRADMRIVYSGHPEIENVVRAMQLGATDFVSKSECPPHKLVERVEQMLIDRKEREERDHLVYEFLSSQHVELGRQYPDRVLAIVVVEAKPLVVADGRSRLDVLLKYADWRRSQATAQWPVVPHLHIVPPAPTR